MICIGKLEISSGFLLLAAWIHYSDRQGILKMVVFACFLHEVSHIAAMKKIGLDVRRIRLTAIGAEISVAQQMGYWQEGAVALAGPGINLVLALLCCRNERGALFSGVNLALGCFNLLPVGSLDGGRALRSALLFFFPPSVVSLVGIILDVAMIAIILLAGIVAAVQKRNVTLLMVGVWLLSAAFRQKGGN